MASHHVPKENGRIYKRLAGDMPHFMRDADGTLSALTHFERFLLRWHRWASPALRGHFIAALELRDADAVREAMTTLAAESREYAAQNPPPWWRDAA